MKKLCIVTLGHRENVTIIMYRSPSTFSRASVKQMLPAGASEWAFPGAGIRLPRHSQSTGQLKGTCTFSLFFKRPLDSHSELVTESDLGAPDLFQPHNLSPSYGLSCVFQKDTLKTDVLTSSISEGDHLFGNRVVADVTSLVKMRSHSRRVGP